MRRETSWRMLLAAFFLVLLAAPAAQAASSTVDAGGTCTLADAIDAANSNADTGGCVGSGVYGDDTITLRADVLLTDALPQISSTITIEGGKHFISGNNTCGRVLHIADTGNLTLNKTIIKDGNNDNGDSGDESGGIYNLGTVTLTNSTVSGNRSSHGSFSGEGIYNLGTVTLTNSTVSGNRAYSAGGGIYNGGTVTLTNSTVSGNRSRYGGGGIYNLGTVTLTNSTISDNSIGGESSYGGGIYNGGTVTLTNSTVSGNRACSGGGIANGGTVTLTNSTVSGNTTTSDGGSSGGGISNSGNVTLTNSTISDNAVSSIRLSRGGGISNSGNVTLKNSTVSGNTAYSYAYKSYGGGVYNGGDYTVTLNSSIISGNTASGSSISYSNELYRADYGTVTANSFNVFGHSGETNAQAFDSFTPGASDINATSDGTTPTALAAILRPLANNGGPTQTQALSEGSPAIDLDTTCSTDLTTDQRGGARPIGEGCDAGAYEFSYLDAINQHCPCTKGSNGQWKNHGQYVSCVSNSAKSFLAAGLITQAEKDAVVSAAAKSTCGKKK